jgi:hypothetical protein
MTTFDDREHAFEAHFAFEEELDFKVQARRDRLVGLWAGGLMGLKDGDLEDYVLSIMRADLREPGDAEVYDKILADLSRHDIAIEPHQVREHMDQCLVAARAELGAGG